MEALPSPTCSHPGFQPLLFPSPPKPHRSPAAFPKSTQAGASSSRIAVAPYGNSRTHRPAFALLGTTLASRLSAGSRSTVTLASPASQLAAPGLEPPPGHCHAHSPGVRLRFNTSCRVKVKGHQDLSLSLALCCSAAAQRAAAWGNAKALDKTRLCQQLSKSPRHR